MKIRLVLGLCTLAFVAPATAACRARVQGLPVARAPATAPAKGPVRALRYRVWVVEGALEATHGGGKWIEELWFPEVGVAANVTWEWDMAAFAEGATSERRPVLHAFHGPLRNRSAPGWGAKEEEQPTQEVFVPYEVAQRLIAHADATHRLQADAKSVAADLARDGLLHDLAGAEAK